MSENTETVKEDVLGEVPSAPLNGTGSSGTGLSTEGSNIARPFEVADNYLSLGAMQMLRQSDEAHLWREQYLRQSFYLVSTVLYLTFIIVIVVGVGLVDLSDTVLVTMLATTVAHVVGILAIAFHWLYPYGCKIKED